MRFKRWHFFSSTVPLNGPLALKLAKLASFKQPVWSNSAITSPDTNSPDEQALMAAKKRRRRAISQCSSQQLSVELATLSLPSFSSSLYVQAQLQSAQCQQICRTLPAAAERRTVSTSECPQSGKHLKTPPTPVIPDPIFWAGPLEHWVFSLIFLALTGRLPRIDIFAHQWFISQSFYVWIKGCGNEIAVFSYQRGEKINICSTDWAALIFLALTGRLPRIDLLSGGSISGRSIRQ